MDFVIIDGQTIPVQSGTFKKNAPIEGGSESYSYNGALRSTVRWQKDSWSFTTGFMEKVDIETLRTATSLGQAVLITGSMPTGTLYCRVKITGETTINAESSDNNNWVVTADVTMMQV
jgi:hypothetical protein